MDGYLLRRKGEWLMNGVGDKLVYSVVNFVVIRTTVFIRLILLVLVSVTTMKGYRHSCCGL